MTLPALRAAARDALLRFGLPDARLTSLGRTRNAVFRVDTPGERFVLRLRTADRFDDAAAGVQLRWLDRLARDTPPFAPRPRRTASGRWFVPVRVGDDRWRATCLSWVPGRSPRGSDFLRPKALRAVGQAVARLHASAEAYRPATMHACPRLDAGQFFGPHTAAGPAGRDYLSGADHDLVRRAAGRIRRAMRRTAGSPAHVGLIHGDLEPPNWAIDAGVPRPIDFDEFGVGPFAFDLMQVLWTHALWADYPRFRADLLAGYEAVRPMTAADRAELDLYQAIPFLVWLNRGSDPARRDEMRQWVGPTVKRVGELCGVG